MLQPNDAHRDPNIPAELLSADPFRRLASAFYDGLLLLALLMVITSGLQLLTHGRALIEGNIGLWAQAYHALLVLAITGYFQVCWTVKGQTLGMKAWSLKLLNRAGDLPSTVDVLRRLALSAPMYLLIVASILYTMRWHAPVVWEGLASIPLAIDLLWSKRASHASLVDLGSGTRIHRLPTKTR